MIILLLSIVICWPDLEKVILVRCVYPHLCKGTNKPVNEQPGFDLCLVKALSCF